MTTSRIVRPLPCSILAGLVLTSCADAAFGPLDQLPRELTPAERSVISSANDFGLELFGRLSSEAPEENLFFSPVSAYLALGMTANGAAGETLDAMRRTLRQGSLAEEEANEAYRGLLDLFLGLDPSVEFTIANSIWYRLGLPVLPDFIRLSSDVFDADVTELDFLDPRAARTINAWVEERTAGRIKDLVAKLSAQDVMLLINAIYFKGTWQHPFDPGRTHDELFERLDGEFVEVPMMMRRGVELLRYQRTEEFEAAELLYGRGAFVMTIIVPHQGSPLDLIATLDAPTWDRWMDGFEETAEIQRIELPKFRLEWEKSLKNDLKAMGMAVAFGAADFSRLAQGGDGLFISDVKQKAFVEVNEEGTEAAAATSVDIADSARPTFSANRPFLFAIRERFSGTILFLGQMLDPGGG